jgi:hypothetical protein
MQLVKIVAILLIVGGTLGLAFGRLTFNKQTQSASFGPIGLTIKESQTMVVPTWLAIAAIAGGSLLLLAKKRGTRS